MGTIIIFFILLIIIIATGVCLSIFSNIKKNGIEYKVSKNFIKEYNPNIGEDVKFWLNPKNNIINIYLKGTVSGTGKIGEINSIPDIKKLENDQLHAKINIITENSIFIKFY
jgi:hypothetical protein